MESLKFQDVRQRYYDWKAMQPRDPKQAALEVEQAALKWGYEAGRADVEKQVRERLFDFKG